MNKTTPDHTAVRGAIVLATRAPSVRNTQPWHWLIGNRSVHLMADWTRHAASIDPSGRDLMISCGAALHHLKVALCGLGWAARVHRMPNPGDPAHLATIEMRSHQPSEEDSALLMAIGYRRTDRRRYSSWPVPQRHVQVLMECATQAGVFAVRVTDPSDRRQLTRAITTAAARYKDDPAYRAESPGWAEDDTYGTGELLVIATSADDLLSRLRAGEAASATLLCATRLGLATCPISQPLELVGTRHAIRNRMFEGAATPQLILRAGWPAAAAEPIPMSPRRHPHEVTTILPGVNSGRVS